MLTRIGLIAVAAVLALAGVVALQPATYSVSRTAKISAAPAEIFALVNDFHKWDGWSPWAKLDPNMKTHYSGSPAGTGAVYHWESAQDDVGEGRMTITESVPDKQVLIRLEFIKPFASVANTRFSMQPAAGETSATTIEWTMSGENDFITKGFMLAMGGMDKAVGGDFEKGLAQMKALAEKK
ncbi:MAG: SRPBCC family protein [Bryobacterales bacterium]|nr:SRPBCC family protein [Bryobacterales bacterium]